MSNPFSRLISQAEINLGDISRRAMESATAPIKAKSQEIIADVVSSATSAVRTLAIKAALALFAVVMLVVAMVFGLIALCRYLERVTGPIEALVIMGGLFLVLAIIAVVVLMMWPSGKPKAAKVAQRHLDDARAAFVASEAAAERAEISADEADALDALRPTTTGADLKSGFDAVVSALGEAGFKREQAGLRAGLVIANQLRPVQLVSLALLGGFLAGIRITAARNRR